ncbi:hypothetical protein [Hymenobacter siberiensis]|uniref:hypothetical protein n=1 Tax=Hymenobacter siberiensis TaxID=2848396 RepID=UPI001C1DE842|nr:hypothetical protein [Hymenobacter siberiensis]
MKVAQYFLFSLLLIASGCKKDAPEASLPAATHTGANTAGCLINGQPFVATGYGSGLGKVQGIGGGFAYDSAYYLRLNGKFGNQEGSLQIFLNSVPRNANQSLVKTYLLNQSTPVMPAAVPSQCQSYAVFFPNDGSRELYVTDAQHTGKVELTHVDVGNVLAAGNFEFIAVSNLDPAKTIRVTDGRFDRKQ